MDEYIYQLRADAARFDQEAEWASCAFNKGYFDGKAEQCLKLADALQEKSVELLGDDY